MNVGTRAAIAAAGAAFAAAAMYAFGQALYAEEMAEGFTVWDVVAREVLIISILVGLALASPLRRGLRLLWLLAGALWIWLLVLPPLATTDAGPRGVAFLFRSRWCAGSRRGAGAATVVNARRGCCAAFARNRASGFRAWGTPLC
jgi:hypothetical protein